MKIFWKVLGALVSIATVALAAKGAVEETKDVVDSIKESKSDL